MMNRLFIVTAVAGSMTVFLGGCSGSSTAPPAEVTPAPASSSAAPTAADTNCQVATFDGTTSNTALQDLARQIYDSLQCGTDTPLPQQLKAIAADPEIKATAEAAGATLDVDSAAGGTVLSLVAGTSGCNVTVLDAMEAKSATCMDL